MAFPSTPLDVMVELQLGSTWTNITQYVYDRGDDITITRGIQDEGSSTEPSVCNLTLNNRDGRFSPRKATGPYYGQIGRNTPLRVSVLLGSRRLTGAGTIAAPDTAGLSVTGDLDVRFDGKLPSWSPNAVLMSKYGAAGQISWRMYTNIEGKLVLEWSADGTTILSAISTLPVPRGTGRQAVRATLDVNNGAGGRTVSFFTAPTASGTWTQLGTDVVQAGTTSIFDSTTSAVVNVFAGWEVYSAEIRNGIGGSLVGNPICTVPAEGATSFADVQGNTWTRTGTAVVTARRYRFVGEVSNWPPKWDVDGVDVWVPLTASGITRRLGQGAAPFSSPLRRGVATEPSLTGYWPMEDGDEATQFASAVPGGTAMDISGSPTLASDTRVAGSAPLPVMNSSYSSALVPAATPGTIEARVVCVFPAAGDTNAGTILRVYTTGTVDHWDFYYASAAGGTLSVVGLDALENVVAGPQSTHTGVNGRIFQGVMNLTTSGGIITWKLTTVDIATDSGLLTTNTLAGSVGRARSVSVNANPAARLVGTVIGHVHTLSASGANPYSLENYVRGWAPETAGRRIERLCAEESVAFAARGILGPLSGTLGLGDFQRLGPQTADTLLDLIGDAVEADLGLLIEPRDSLGLGYRSREALYNQDPTLALTYGVLSELEPVEDDQSARNDVTVTRTNGSSARARLETGALSILPPPNGIGVYDDQVDLNLYSDLDLGQQAGWRMHLGTIDEARYPTIHLMLEAPSFSASSALTTAALDLDQGDLLTISNPPAWLPPDQIRQIAQGFTETLSQFAYSIEVMCTPASAWDVAVYDETGPTASRYSSDGTTLAAPGLTTTATSLNISTPSGPIWTTDPAEYPFDILVGGEQITVGGCTGTTAAQTFTGCTRSVNGVVKTHTAGEAIELYYPARYAL